MSGFKKIANEQIIKSLEMYSRVILTEEKIAHDEDFKVGIEVAEGQTKATGDSIEYFYLFSGLLQIWDLSTGEELTFRKGDFISILPNTKFLQRANPGTRLLFIKKHGSQDTKSIAVTTDMQTWLAEKIPTKRTDYINDQNAPVPNSLRPAAAVAIFNEQGEILLVQRKDNGKWSMPGGTMDFGETLAHCAVRELKEETGLSVKITDIVGTYTNPYTVIEYTDGEVRQEFAILYHGVIESGSISLDHESLGYKWCSEDELQSLQISSEQLNRIQDAFTFKMNGSQFLK